MKCANDVNTMRWVILVLFVWRLRLRIHAQQLSGEWGVSEEHTALPGGLEYLESSELASPEIVTDDGDPDPPDRHHPVRYAGVPRALSVAPLPLPQSDHEVMLNVSWEPPLGPPADDYSLEVHSETDTADCRMTMCYEYNIPGRARWWSVPARASPVPGACAVRPGCAYRVRLVAHPWDGRAAAELRTQLEECVSGVCSCAHSPRLPAPLVAASAVTVEGELFVNVSWTLPPPLFPHRLPKGLQRKSYFVSIGQQMVSDAHPAPWFAHTVTRTVPAAGPLVPAAGPLVPAAGPLVPAAGPLVPAAGPLAPEARWLLLPAAEGPRRADVRLLARVSVVDERGCVGPAGNATAYDPMKARKVSIATYVLWASLGGAVALGAAAALLGGARAAKRVLRALRPAPVSAPPVRARRAWFPLRSGR